VFEEELEGLLSISAQNLSVRIVPAAGNEFVQVWHSYPSLAEGDVLTLSVGDIYAREPRHVLAEFLLKPAEEGHEQDEVEVATFTVTADVITAKGDIEKQAVTLPVRLSPQEGGLVDPVVRKELLHLEAARARREALVAWARGAFQEAGQKLMVARQRIDAAPWADDDLREEAADLGSLADRSAAGVVEEQDRKYAHQRAYDASRSKRMASKRVSRQRREGDG
jgi:Ca-activated chloride channel family protein